MSEWKTKTKSVTTKADSLRRPVKYRNPWPYWTRKKEKRKERQINSIMNKSDDVSAERIIREREPEHFMPTNSAA